MESLRLFFGEENVTNRQIITPTIARSPLSYEFDTDTPRYLTILLNLSNNYLHWLRISSPGKDEDIVPYVAPFLESNYIFYVFVSSPLLNRMNQRQLMVHFRDRNKFNETHSRKEFGELIGKIYFSVSKYPTSSLTKLNANVEVDILQYIASNEALTMKDILNLCASDPTLKRKICDNDAFYNLLFHYRISDKTTKEIYPGVEAVITKTHVIRYMIFLDEVIAMLTGKYTPNEEDEDERSRLHAGYITETFGPFNIAIRKIFSLLDKTPEWWDPRFNIKLHYFDWLINNGYQRTEGSLNLPTMKYDILTYVKPIYDTFTIKDKLLIPFFDALNDTLGGTLGDISFNPRTPYVETFYNELFFKDPNITLQNKEDIVRNLIKNRPFGTFWFLEKLEPQIEDNNLRMAVQEYLNSENDIN